MTDKHMSVAEFKRHLSDVMAEVVHTKRRVIVEKRGRPMVAVIPLDEDTDTRTPGQRLAAIIGFGGEEGERFRQEMQELLPLLRSDYPREVPEFWGEEVREGSEGGSHPEDDQCGG